MWRGAMPAASRAVCASNAVLSGTGAQPPADSPGGAAPPAAPSAAAALAARSAAAQPAGVPGIVRALGYGGVIPFLALSPPIAEHLPLHLLDDALAASAGTLQIAYGCGILSFLGGVHWGLAMVPNLGGAGLRSERYLWSVLPCLMAWPTVAMPVAQGAGIQAALLGLVFFVDRAWAQKGLLPPWYLSMRLSLTVLAAGGLALTAATAGA